MDDVIAKVELPRRRFTWEEYHRMGEVGVLKPRERVELIEGEIIVMTPIGPRHSACVAELNRRLVPGDRRPRAAVAPEPRSASRRYGAGAGHRAVATAR